MVQRKRPDKLGIQAEHVKPEKRPGSLKPASCLHQDGKSRGPDMKKKMKRSRSMKLSDIESLKSSPLRKPTSQPGKPPPGAATATAPTTAASPKKQLPIRAAHGSPNYMKSTSSSEARKERSLVSSLNTQTCSDSKNPRQRSLSALKHSSASSDKTFRPLKKSSSLKLVRTLTKTPSFKPVRGTPKKCSRVALCAEVNVEKATCSSTLKDSKFPAYLMLNPGGTEAEGTSVMKVCPYTYCSLNGHCHTPLPPLKCFLKARRRSLKTQKSMKLEILPQSRAKPSSDAAEEILHGLLSSPDGKAPCQEMDSAEPVKVPVLQVVGPDFFIEIYEKCTAAANEKGKKECDHEAGPLAVDPEDRNNGTWSGGGNEVEQQISKLGFEHLPARLPGSVFDFVEHFEEHSDMSSVATDASGSFPENQAPEEVDTEYKINLYQEDETSFCPEETREREISIWNDTQRECEAGMEEDNSVSDSIDMDWEEAICAAEVDTGDNTMNSLGVGSLHKLVEEVTTSFHIKNNDTSSKHTYPTNQWDIFEPFQPPPKDAIKEPTFMSERNSINSWPTSDSTEALLPESMAAMVNFEDDGDSVLEKGAQEANPVPDKKAGVSYGQQDHASDTWVQNPTDGYGQVATEILGIEADEEYSKSQHSQLDKSLAMSCQEEEVSSNGAGKTEEGKDLLAGPDLPYNDQISSQSGSFSGSDQVYAEVNNSQVQMIGTYEENELGEESSSCQGLSDDCNSAYPNNNQFNNLNEGIKKQNLTAEDLEETNKMKLSTSTVLEEQNLLGMRGMNSATNSLAAAQKTDLRDDTKPDAAEPFLTADKGNNQRPEARSWHKGQNPNPARSNNGNKRRWTIGCGHSLKDLKEEKGFNPREPNFLPAIPDPETEKVDLKHNMMDDRKNAEEWMIDYALQQAVTKLASTRKKKVALMVEAFETVSPIQKYDTHIRHSSAVFSPRPIQACS